MQVAQVQDDKIIIQDRDDIKLDGRKGAIVKVLGCGLCGSDIVKFKNKIAQNGAVLGHEIVGVVEEIDSETQYRVGERIVCSHHVPCFECNYCKHENYSMCQHFKETNIFPGGFSEKIFVSEEHLKKVTYRVPPQRSEEEISFLEPLACCVRAVKRCELQKGDRVLVIGLGSIGILMSQAIKAMGFNAYGCDILDERIEIANKYAIEAYNSKDIEYFKKLALDKTDNYGFDAIFMTSGADKAIELALKVVRKGGKISVFSSIPSNLGYLNNEIYYNEITVMGAYSSAPKDMQQAYLFLANGHVNVKGLSTTYLLQDIQKAFDDTISNKTMKAYIKMQKVNEIIKPEQDKKGREIVTIDGRKITLPKIENYSLEKSTKKHDCWKTDEEFEKKCEEIHQISNSKFCLPAKDVDLIQSIIFGNKNYWDIALLKKVDNLLPDNAVILDVGANIGNHTLYWANERKAQKIYAFEPYPYSFKILEKNIENNNLEGVVIPCPFGLSDENSRQKIKSFCDTNIGGTGFGKCEDGDFEFKTLDSLDIEEKVDLMKIDVEGSEIEMLHGALEFIKKNKPVICIESFCERKPKVDKILGDLGYQQVDDNACMGDYIYKYML